MKQAVIFDYGSGSLHSVAKALILFYKGLKQVIVFILSIVIVFLLPKKKTLLLIRIMGNLLWLYWQRKIWLQP
ncbi:MAG: hypothetical protein ACK4M7_06990, partial [Burkholderiales bacterium]